MFTFCVVCKFSHGWFTHPLIIECRVLFILFTIYLYKKLHMSTERRKIKISWRKYVKCFNANLFNPLNIYCNFQTWVWYYGLVNLILLISMSTIKTLKRNKYIPLKHIYIGRIRKTLLHPSIYAIGHFFCSCFSNSKSWNDANYIRVAACSLRPLCTSRWWILNYMCWWAITQFPVCYMELPETIHEKSVFFNWA